MVVVSEFGESSLEILDVERARGAERYLVGYTHLKKEEQVVILWDRGSDPKLLECLRDGARRVIGKDPNVIELTGTTNEAELLDQVNGHELIVDLALSSDADIKLYDQEYLKKSGSRMLAVLDAPVSIFDPGGLTEESPELVRNRLDKMEASLNDAYGLEITTAYGTSLKLKLNTGNRAWKGVMGELNEAGDWDNIGAEVYTTPSEWEIDGLIRLPAVDSEISNRQGVDQFIDLEVVGGKVVSISGGRVAETLRKKLEKDAKNEEKMGRDPTAVYRIAEMAFGASAGVPLVSDEKKSWRIKGVPSVLKEKSLGSLHLALGNSDHGETETAGHFTDTETHYELIIPGSGGLKVKKFTNEKDYLSGKNGKMLFDQGITTELLGV